MSASCKMNRKSRIDLCWINRFLKKNKRQNISPFPRSWRHHGKQNAINGNCLEWDKKKRTEPGRSGVLRGGCCSVYRLRLLSAVTAIFEQRWSSSRSSRNSADHTAPDRRLSVPTLLSLPLLLLLTWLYYHRYQISGRIFIRRTWSISVTSQETAAGRFYSDVPDWMSARCGR